MAVDDLTVSVAAQLAVVGPTGVGRLDDPAHAKVLPFNVGRRPIQAKPLGEMPAPHQFPESSKFASVLLHHGTVHLELELKGDVELVLAAAGDV